MSLRTSDSHHIHSPRSVEATGHTTRAASTPAAAILAADASSPLSIYIKAWHRGPCARATHELRLL